MQSAGYRAQSKKMDKKSRVSIVGCGDYDPKKLRESIQKSLDLIGGLGTVMRKGDNVLLKPNMMAGKAPEFAINTHPLFVGALFEVIRDFGAKAVIAESPGGAIFGTKRVWKNSGMEDVAKKIGAPILKLETCGNVKFNPKFSKKEFYISKPVLDADVVVSVPKFKVHGTMLLTGAIKNLLGTIPGIHKIDFHKEAPKPDEFGDALSDIFAAVKPKLAVMDAIVGMEGNGPTFGNPRQVGFVLAGNDCVAMDAVVAQMMGIPPLDVYATKHAARKGLGVADLKKIEISGVSLEQAKIKGWKLDFTSNSVVKKIPRVLLKLYGAGFKADMIASEKKCKACGECVKGCPTQARFLDNNLSKADSKKCVRCLQCFEICKTRAIRPKFSYLAKQWLKSQAGGI